MADVNKSVQISYRADLKQLINQLQKMPGVTEQEAKKMVAQLDRQFKRAERSAKKAATAQSKAMKRVKTSADQAAVSVQDLGDQAGDLDRAFMGASQAASLLNPALGEAVMIGSDAAAIFEAITLGLNALNPVFLAIAATVGAAAVAFGGLNAANEKRLDLLSRLREAEEVERDRLSNLANTVSSVADRYTKASEELSAFTGQLNDADLDRIRATREINKATQADVDAMSERIRQSEILVKILSREQTLMADMTEEEKELLKAAQLRFQSVSNSADLEGTTRKSISARLNLTKELTQEIHNEEQIREAIIIRGEQTLDMQNLLVQLQREFNEEQEKEEKRQEKIRSHREAIHKLDVAINAAQEQGLDPIEKIELGFQKQIDHLKEQEHLVGNNAQKRIDFINAITTLEKLQAAAVRDAILATDDEEQKSHIENINRTEKLAQLKHQLHLMNLSGDELEEQKIIDKYNTELDKIRELSLATEEYHLFQKARVQLQSQMDQELHDQRIGQIKDEFKLGLETALGLQSEVSSLLDQKASKLEDQLDKDIDSTKERYQSETEMIEDQLKMKQITDAEANRMRVELKRKEASELHRIETQQQSEILKLRTQEFRLNQTAALANIAFRTSEAIMASLATYPGIPGALLAAAAGATGATQAAIVLNQQPPESHMGGFLAPDEQIRTVLTGEAVLDRATVNRIGGESGVRSLMNEGQSDNQVVVIQPFRHVDRYNRSARQMRGRSASRRY